MGAERAEAAVDGTTPGGSNEPRVGYQAMLDLAPEGQLVTDGQGVIVEANQAAAAVLRCPKEFLIGKPLGLFVASGYRPRFYDSLARLHSTAEYDEFETRVGQRDRLRDVCLRVAALGRGADGEVAFRWTVRDVTELRRAEAAREELLRRLVTVQEEERRRVARELHDSVGQLLSALILGVRAVRDAGPISGPALARLEEVQRVADELGRVTHELAVQLRPTALDDFGLHAALRHYLEDWSWRTGLAVQFEFVGPESARLPAEVETALYRVVQEALTNVLKHAAARLISVVVERQDAGVVLVVEDDGNGFDPETAAASGRLGLIGMRERVALVGGVLEVESSPGVGTTVVARIPIQ